MCAASEAGGEHSRPACPAECGLASKQVEAQPLPLILMLHFYSALLENANRTPYKLPSPCDVLCICTSGFGFTMPVLLTQTA